MDWNFIFEIGVQIQDRFKEIKMSKIIKDKANLELILKNILYYIEDEQEQAKMIAILERYNDELPDGKLKDKIQKTYCKVAKRSYYEKVDFLINDILNGKIDTKEVKAKVKAMINELKPSVEVAQKTWWEKLMGLGEWS